MYWFSDGYDSEWRVVEVESLQFIFTTSLLIAEFLLRVLEYLVELFPKLIQVL